MIRSPTAIITLIRNRLNSNKDLKKTIDWFSEKGIQVIHDKDLYFLKAGSRAIKSEFTEVCNGLVFRGANIVVFPGSKIRKYTLEDAKELEFFIWNNDTIFIEYIKGKQVYMFWDPGIEDWNFSNDRKYKTPYAKMLRDKLYNIMSVEYSFTYCFKIVEESIDAGIYLETIYDNKRFKELPWTKVYQYSTKIKVKHPEMYLFEGFENLEEKDFPLIARDVSGNKIMITSIK